MFSVNQKPFVICTRVTEKLHSFLSQSELSNFLVYIIHQFSNRGVGGCSEEGTSGKRDTNKSCNVVETK